MSCRTGPALIMLATIPMTGGRISPAADWSETLEAGANAAYVTNPQMIAGSHQGDEYAQLVVDGSAVAQTELSQLTVTPRFASTHYRDETNLDIDTGSIDLGYQRKFERGQWTFDGHALTDSTVTSELGTTGITNISQRHYANTVSSSAQYSLTPRLAWQLQGAWQDTRYTDAQQFGLTNYSYGSVQSGPIWTLSDRLQASLVVGADKLSPQSGLAEKDYSASVKLKRNVTEQYAWHASAGATRVNAGSAGSSTTSTFEVGVSRQTERVQWDLSATRAVLPIGIGLLAQENTAAFSLAVSTSERSTLNLSASGIRTDPVTEYLYLAPGISLGFQVYSGASWGQLTAEWRHHLTERWIFSAAYIQARARSGTPQETAIGNQARLAILWQSGRL